jgi:hypothetical protein
MTNNYKNGNALVKLSALENKLFKKPVHGAEMTQKRYAHVNK